MHGAPRAFRGVNVVVVVVVRRPPPVDPARAGPALPTPTTARACARRPAAGPLRRKPDGGAGAQAEEEGEEAREEGEEAREEG
eukprot:gene13222-biopygen8002